MNTYKKDKYYLRYKNIVMSNKIDTTAFIEKCSDIQSKRCKNIVKLNRRKPGSVVDIIAFDQAYRSDILFHKLSINTACDSISSILDTMRSVILAKYGSYVSGSTVAIRDSKLEYLLREGYTLINEYTRSIDQADQIISDIDKASFAFKHMLEGLDIAARREIIV